MRCERGETQDVRREMLDVRREMLDVRREMLEEEIEKEILVGKHNLMLNVLSLKS